MLCFMVTCFPKLHGKLMARLEGLEPKALQHALAQAIAAKRVKATRGDVFGPEVEPLLRRRAPELLRR